MHKLQMKLIISNFIRWDALDLLLLCVCWIHVVVSPFTKVEESFNMQATHDILFHGLDIDSYDHNDFPGVVPRTFFGPLVLSLFTYPLHLLPIPKIVSQYIIRFSLGFFVIVAFSSFRRSVEAKFGRHTSIFLALITITQFHFLFYASRLLPNTFALIFVLFAFSAWIRGNMRTCICCLTFAMVVFRSEIAILAGPLVLYTLFSKEIRLVQVLRWGFATLLSSLGLTVPMDSFFWRRLLWPELVVFWFNTFHNKSKEWGTYPFWWYFTSALPRACLGALVVIPYSLYHNAPLRKYFAIAYSFVLIYSFLPHKELRFVIYIVPILNLGAAMTMELLWRKGASNVWFHVCVCILISNATMTCIFTVASADNYPGANALLRLQKEFSSETIQPYVHMETCATMTGVTRFLKQDSWRYSKAEDIDDFSDFSHILSDRSHIPGFDMIFAQYGHDRIQRIGMGVLRSRIPKVYAHQKNLTCLESPQSVIPVVQWSQDEFCVNVTFLVGGIVDTDVLTRDSYLFVAFHRSQNTCAGHFVWNLFGDISNDCILREIHRKSVVVSLKKANIGTWTRLTKHGTFFHQ